MAPTPVRAIQLCKMQPRTLHLGHPVPTVNAVRGIARPTAEGAASKDSSAIIIGQELGVKQLYMTSYLPGGFPEHLPVDGGVRIIFYCSAHLSGRANARTKRQKLNCPCEHQIAEAYDI